MQDFLEFHILCQHIESIRTTKILDISWIKKVESFIVIILPIISLFFNQEDIRSLIMMAFSSGN